MKHYLCLISNTITNTPPYIVSVISFINLVTNMDFELIENIKRKQNKDISL